MRHEHNQKVYNVKNINNSTSEAILVKEFLIVTEMLLVLFFLN